MAFSIRPTTLLDRKPVGHLELASYSSLNQFWSYIEAGQRAGRQMITVQGDNEDVCRRRISGHRLDGASLLLDEARVRREVKLLEDTLEPNLVLLALSTSGTRLLRETLNASYTLRLDFVLALTQQRDLIVRPEFKFTPKSDVLQFCSPLPRELPLKVRRLGRDEIHFLLQWACGMYVINRNESQSFY